LREPKGVHGEEEERDERREDCELEDDEEERGTDEP